MISLSKLPEGGAIKRQLSEIASDGMGSFKHEAEDALKGVYRDGQISASDLLSRLLQWNVDHANEELIMDWIEEMQEAQK